MKFCASCKINLPDYARNCPQCGRRLSEEVEHIQKEESLPVNKTDKRGIIIPIVVGIVAVVALIVLLVVFIKKSKTETTEVSVVESVDVSNDTVVETGETPNVNVSVSVPESEKTEKIEKPVVITPPAEKLTVPDIEDTDEVTAKNVLSSNGLIPSIKYEYSDTLEVGKVIRTEPAIGSEIKKNSKIILYVSAGPYFVEAKDAKISFTCYDVEFSGVYIEDGVMYIPCYNVIFEDDLTWNDRYGKGRILGLASTTSSFDKTVPVSAQYEKQYWEAYESQNFTLEIPLADLETSRPTDLHIVLYTGDYEDDVYFDFYMSW